LPQTTISGIPDPGKKYFPDYLAHFLQIQGNVRKPGTVRICCAQGTDPRTSVAEPKSARKTVRFPCPEFRAHLFTYLSK
jgi:hypothetical protein